MGHRWCLLSGEAQYIINRDNLRRPAERKNDSDRRERCGKAVSRVWRALLPVRQPGVGWTVRLLEIPVGLPESASAGGAGHARDLSARTVTGATVARTVGRAG